MKYFELNSIESSSSGGKGEGNGTRVGNAVKVISEKKKMLKQIKVRSDRGAK